MMQSKGEVVRTTGTREERAAFHALAAEVKRASLSERRRLGAAFLREHSDQSAPHIDPALGVFTRDLSGLPLMQEVLAEARRQIARNVEAVRSKGSIDFLTAGSDYEPDSAAIRLAFSHHILGPVITYLGMAPILFNVCITRANSAELIRYSTHSFHLDPEDLTQVKVFVHLSDVDLDCGPFHALPANLSEQVLRGTDYVKGRLTDDQVEAVIGPDQALPSLGPAGTVTFCDTNRCFHFGGRPRAEGRPHRDLLMFHYVLPTSTWYPLHAGDGEAPMRLSLQTRGEPLWDALIGASLLI